MSFFCLFYFIFFCFILDYFVYSNSYTWKDSVPTVLFHGLWGNEHKERTEERYSQDCLYGYVGVDIVINDAVKP